MLYSVAICQSVVLVLFFVLERFICARQNPRKIGFYSCLTGISIFAISWLQFVLYCWPIELPSLFAILLPPIAEGFVFYLFYSFGNYWFHRWKHADPRLWRWLHSLHHAPNHMESVVAFFRHPAEIVANTVYLVLIGKLLFGVSAEALLIALTIEGCLEVFHHSNIRTPCWLRPLGYLIQLPEMHLVHHQMGLHKYNYGPFLWDFVFRTVRIPQTWDQQLGLRTDLFSLLVYKKS